jgi:hypothetical protein
MLQIFLYSLETKWLSCDVTVELNCTELLEITSWKTFISSSFRLRASLYSVGCVEFT